jgi:hypothetical protein
MYNFDHYDNFVFEWGIDECQSSPLAIDHFIFVRNLHDMKYNISYGNHGNYKFILNHKFGVTI